MESLMMSTDHLVVAGALNDVLVWTFRFLFFASAVLLMVIVLLQEGKGGGLASALGGQGAETFGVSTGGVNRVTLFLAGLFLFSALGHALSFDPSVSKGLGKKGKGSTQNPIRDIPGGEDDEDGAGGGGGTGGGDVKKDGGTAPVKDPVKDPAKDPAKEPAKDPAKEPAKDGPPPAPPVKDDAPKAPAPAETTVPK
jgi:preprotein translocase subunit SecG